ELFRLACAAVLSCSGSLTSGSTWGNRPGPADRSDGPLSLTDVAAVGAALTEVTDATLAAGLAIARAATQPPPGLRFAIIGMGRLGGYEMNYLSDADVLFVYDAPDGVPERAAR